MVPLRESVLPDVLVVALGGVVGRVQVEKAHRAVVLPDELFKVLILDDHLGQPPVGLLDEGEVAPHIVGLASEAGQPGGVAVPDQLVEPRRPLDVAGGAVSRQGGADAVEVLPRVQHIPQRLHQLLRLVPHTAVQVDQQAVEVIVDLEVVAGRLVEQYPPPAAEHLDVPLIVEGEQPDDQLPQGFLAPDPGHETVQGTSPPSSGRRICPVSNRSRERFRPWMAAAMPPIRRVRWAMVARTSCSVAA